MRRYDVLRRRVIVAEAVTEVDDARLVRSRHLTAFVPLPLPHSSAMNWP